MFKKITHGLIALLALLVIVPQVSAQSNPVSAIFGESEGAGYFIFGQTQNYYELRDQLQNKKLELEIFQSNLSEAEKSITETTSLLQRLQVERASLENQINELLTQNPAPATQLVDLNDRLQTLDQEIDQASTQIQELQQALSAEEQAEKNAQIEVLQTQIANLEAEVDSSQIKLKNYLQNSLKKVLVAIGILISAWVLKWIIRNIFSRLKLHINAQRQAFILQLINIVINILAITAILMVFFSQLLSTLPYLAIFATVVTLALRDVILSVIAWIIIGTKDGYKVGHYLKVGNLWGRVVEINPFNTIIRQGGFSGPTGRLITFPNKKIFEEFMENWSKWQNVTFMRFDFFLEQDCDFEKAEKILLDILKKNQKPHLEFIEKRRKHLIKMGLREHEFEPMVFWQSQPNGILLRGKFLMDFDERFTMRAKVTRDMVIAVRKEKDITLRFVQNINIPEHNPL